MWCDTLSVRHETQLTARCVSLSVVCVLGVTIVVHIGHDDVLVIVVIYVAIFVVLICNWRCTLYTPRR